MPAQRTRSEVPFNRHMLRWAREWRRRTVDEAASKVRTSADKITEWEEGTSKPTVRQARLLAEFYERPFLEFFLPEPPEVQETPKLVDYRLYAGKESPSQPDVEPILRWAQEVRLNALDLYDLLGEQPSRFPPSLYATIDDDPERVAAKVREASEFTLDSQTSLRANQRYEIVRILRQAVERLGVLVLRDTELADYGARGVCLYDEIVPVIVFGKEAPTAQAFTIAHELGHVVLQDGSISGPLSASSDPRRVADTERWCNRFSAAYLMPREAINEVWPLPNQPLDEVTDDQLSQVANHFSVSPHAALIRLVELGYVRAEFYWNKKRAEFVAAESESYRGFGRAAYYGTRYRSAVGDTYTGLVIEALNNGLVTHHSASEFMGIKNPKHLSDIVENFRP